MPLIHSNGRETISLTSMVTGKLDTFERAARDVHHMEVMGKLDDEDNDDEYDYDDYDDDDLDDDDEF